MIKTCKQHQFINTLIRHFLPEVPQLKKNFKTTILRFESSFACADDEWQIIEEVWSFE